MKLLMLKRYILYKKKTWFKKNNNKKICVNEDDRWRFSDGHFFLSFFCCLFFSTCDYVFLLCNIARAGLDLVGGVRRDLRVQSYHVFYLIVSLRFTIVSVFKHFLCVLSLQISLYLTVLLLVWLDGDRFLPPVTQSHSETISLAASFLSFQLLTRRQCWKVFQACERANLFI